MSDKQLNVLQQQAHDKIMQVAGRDVDTSRMSAFHVDAVLNAHDAQIRERYANEGGTVTPFAIRHTEPAVEEQTWSSAPATGGVWRRSNDPNHVLLIPQYSGVTYILDIRGGSDELWHVFDVNNLLMLSVMVGVADEGDDVDTIRTMVAESALIEQQRINLTELADQAFSERKTAFINRCKNLFGHWPDLSYLKPDQLSQLEMLSAEQLSYEWNRDRFMTFLVELTVQGAAADNAKTHLANEADVRTYVKNVLDKAERAFPMPEKPDQTPADDPKARVMDQLRQPTLYIGAAQIVLSIYVIRTRAKYVPVHLRRRVFWVGIVQFGLGRLATHLKDKKEGLQ